MNNLFLFLFLFSLSFSQPQAQTPTLTVFNHLTSNNYTLTVYQAGLDDAQTFAQVLHVGLIAKHFYSHGLVQYAQHHWKIRLSPDPNPNNLSHEFEPFLGRSRVLDGCAVTAAEWHIHEDYFLVGFRSKNPSADIPDLLVSRETGQIRYTLLVTNHLLEEWRHSDTKHQQMPSYVNEVTLRKDMRVYWNEALGPAGVPRANNSVTIHVCDSVVQYNQAHWLLSLSTSEDVLRHSPPFLDESRARTAHWHVYGTHCRISFSSEDGSEIADKFVDLGM